MNKLESAKIIVEQYEANKNEQWVYEQARQYIAEHKQEAKPEHKPCPGCKNKMSYHTVSGELNCLGADCPVGSKHCYNNEAEAWADWDREWKEGERIYHKELFHSQDCPYGATFMVTAGNVAEVGGVACYQCCRYNDTEKGSTAEKYIVCNYNDKEG